MGNEIRMQQLHIAEHDQYVHDQGQTGTCWANAITQTIISLQRYRMLDLKDQQQSLSIHKILVDGIIRTYGDNEDKGKTTNEIMNILKEECKINVRGQIAMFYTKNVNDIIEFIKLKHIVVIASFSLSKQQWSIFNTFFRENRDGILTKEVFNNPDNYLSNKSYKEKKENEYSGHAVVIVEYEDGIYDTGNVAKYFKIKNSWSINFADNGYFKIDENAFPNRIEYVKAINNDNINDLIDDDEGIYNDISSKFDLTVITNRRNVLRDIDGSYTVRSVISLIKDEILSDTSRKIDITASGKTLLPNKKLSDYGFPKATIRANYVDVIFRQSGGTNNQSYNYFQ